MMGFAVGVLVGGAATTDAAAFCFPGERVDLIDPVVTVVEGPGDPAVEDVLWSDFERLFLEGPQQMHIDHFWAVLERNP
jgi:hypothetical protein